MSAPRPFLSPELHARLEAYGHYSYHQPSLVGRWIGVPAEIEWESPAGFDNGRAPISVTLWFPGGKGGSADLARLLDALDEFRQHLPEHIEDVESLILRGFRDSFERELTNFVRERLRGGSESISDAAILGDVTALRYRFDATGKVIVRSAAVESEWSHEHGMTVEWDELSSTVPSPKEPHDDGY